MSIKNNTTALQNLLEIVKSLPEANNGVELPTLTNEGTASDLLYGKQLIDAEGNVVEGSFTIDSELSTQDSLITQIQTALQNKVSASEPILQEKTVTPSISSQTVKPDDGYDGLSQVTVNGDSNLIADNIKSGVSIFGVTGTHSGGGSGSGSASVETCTVTLTEGNLMLGSPTIYYTDSNMTIQTVTTSLGTLTVPVGTIIVIVNCTSLDSIEGNGKQIFYGAGCAAYKINGTCRITLESI